MRRLCRLLIGIIVLSAPALAQSPEVDAVLDTLLAKDIETAAKHLPPALQKAVLEMPPERRNELASELLLTRHEQSDGIKVTRNPGNDVLLAVEEPRGEYTTKMEFRLDKRISDGDEAVLRISIRTNGEDFKPFELWMRYEETNWRFYQISEVGSDVLDLNDPKLLEELSGIPRSETAETAAIATVRLCNDAILTYQHTYPDVGVPTSLDDLGPPAEGMRPSEYHAGLLDAGLSSSPYQRSGYVFTYRSHPDGSPTTYELIARPVEYGTNGKRSFLTNQTGVIRATSEDREPTADDPPVK